MKFSYPKALFLLLVVSFLFRFTRLSFPPDYVFDEVYHVPAVKAISAGNRDAYNPFAQAPEPNTAYDWLHPPLAKLIQASSIHIFGNNSFAWRFPSVVFGTVSIAVLYYLALVIFKQPQIALTAAALFAFDNLQLTMSRITMNDIFVTTWIMLSLTFFYKKKLYLTGLFAGLALATKHSAILLYPIFFIFLLPQWFKSKRKLYDLLIYIYCLLIVPLVIYLFAYLQLFIQGGTFKDFIDLHRQIYWYQTHLTATHGYQSTAWQWFWLVRPVWFYVKYLPDKVANIYNLGNPAVFWGGAASLMYLVYNRKFTTFASRFVLFSFLILWLPWQFSPRILFLHHYLPSLPWLCLLTAFALYKLKSKTLIISYLTLVIVCFLFFYPLNTGIFLPFNWLKYWFWLPTWR